MLLQRGRFTINNINELNRLPEEDDGIKKIIDLNYMGQIEYEGITIPLSRMYIEYNKENYSYHYLDMFDTNGNQMIVYSINDLDFDKLPNKLLNSNYSLYEYIKNPNKEYINNFWWNVNSHYFVFFGEEKIELIEYFINNCYQRDGGKELIKQKIYKCGYIIK